MAQKTTGKIPRLIDPGQIDTNTVMVLVNAIYLQALWASPFFSGASRPMPFHVTSTRTTNPVFMFNPETQGDTTPGYKIAVLPYRGNKLEAVALMPTTKSLADFVHGFHAADLGPMTAHLPDQVKVYLPKFTDQFKLDLSGPLKLMGMPIAFTGAADFSALTPEPIELQFAVQADYLRVSEAGTEATAATGIGAEPSAAEFPPPPDIHFDHPFLFLIRDNTTGAILFASEVRNPSA